jgi:hypothetical protein
MAWNITTTFYFALKYAIRQSAENYEGLELDRTQQCQVFADDNLLGENIHTINEKHKSIIKC